MNLPLDLIQKVDLLLGTTSRPHLTYEECGLDHADRGSLEWLLPFKDDVGFIPSPNLSKSLTTVDEILRREGVENIAEYYQKHPDYLTGQQLHPMDEIRAHSSSIVEGFRESVSPDKKVDHLLREIKGFVRHLPVLVYKGLDCASGMSFEVSTSDRIIISQGEDQFDILRMEFTAVPNYFWTCSDIIEKLSLIDDQYGIEIIGVADELVEFALKHIPTGEQARALGEYLFDFCPDPFMGEAPRHFPSGRIVLSWD